LQQLVTVYISNEMAQLAAKTSARNQVNDARDKLVKH
jgi:hypothetical protein